jgi:hypothetical protein
MKRATITPPLAQQCGGGGSFLCSPEYLLYKNVSDSYIIIKSPLKLTKKFVERYFARHS